MVNFEELKGKLRGPQVLMMTPFKDNYELNIEALKENIQFVIDGGIGNGKEGGIICPCGNGEYASLSPEEHKIVVKATVEAARDKIPVTVGVQSCGDYRAVIKMALNAAEVGANCVMIPAPYYHPISQEGIYRWYRLVADGIKDKIGIMVYPHAWRTHVGTFISLPLMGKLAGIESIVAFKWGATSLKNNLKALSLYSKRFSLLTNTILYSRELAHMRGEAGFASGIGAFWPEFEAKYWSLLKQRKYEETVEMYAKLYPYNEFLLGKGQAGSGPIDWTEARFNASVIKTALEYVGLYGGPVRPPFVGLTEEQKKEFFGVLEGLGVPKKR